MDFDYPDFEEPKPEKPAVPDSADTSAIPLSPPTSSSAVFSGSGSVPSFNRALKPKMAGTSIAQSIMDSVAKDGQLNNARNLNSAGNGLLSSQGVSLMANNLYPNVVATAAGSGVKKGVKNTNVDVEKSRISEVGFFFSVITVVLF